MNKFFKLTTIIGLLFLAACSPSNIPFDDLVVRQGLTYEVNSQSPFSGISVTYHENGQLKIKGNYKDGKINGLWEYYHENGQLERKGNWKGEKWVGQGKFKDGKEDEVYESFYDDGQLRLKANVKEGKFNGLSEWYDGDGQLQSKECYKNGDVVDMSYCETTRE